MGPTLSPETSAFKLQTPRKFPEEYKLHSEHGESLKTTTPYTFLTFIWLENFPANFDFFDSQKDTYNLLRILSRKVT